MIPTSVKKIDKILGGGLKGGITDIYGAPGTGKTQLALQVSANCLLLGKKVLFQDTVGKFRPERLLEILKENNRGRDLLENVKVSRITNTSEQFGGLSTMDDDGFALLVVDSSTELFFYEYPEFKHAADRNRILAIYMRKLSRMSLRKNIPVLITNTAVCSDGLELESLHAVMNMFAHVRIHLYEKKPGDPDIHHPRDVNDFSPGRRPDCNSGVLCAPRECTVELPLTKSKFSYEITAGGITETA